MPIITSLVTEPPPTDPPPAQAPPPALPPNPGRPQATYTDPAGGVWPLTDPWHGWFTLADGVSGIDAAPYELTLDPYPRGGGRLRHAQPQVRDIVWPLHVYGADHGQFIDRWRQLGRAFTRTLRDGPGILEIARPDGTRRRIGVRYREGFTGSGEQGHYRIDDTAVITLACEDPYWYDPVPQVVHREHSVGVPFLDPFPTVSSGQVLGATTVFNPGDITVWPTWVISGPASLVEFMNDDTGESFTLDPDAAGIAHGPLLAGQQVTVRTDPPQVRYQDGSNWTAALDWPDAVLWGLEPGANQISFQLSGSGPGSAVDLSFFPRYEVA
ncbi:phage tail protein [Streptomyces synnematoformans]|uniref:Phage tail protein n=1 Tax=Streptomyces synnematoformans TaxID=415721 RepID=A0ABN2XA62_9ACTN